MFCYRVWVTRAPVFSTVVGGSCPRGGPRVARFCLRGGVRACPCCLRSLRSARTRVFCYRCAARAHVLSAIREHPCFLRSRPPRTQPCFLISWVGHVYTAVCVVCLGWVISRALVFSEIVGGARTRVVCDRARTRVFRYRRLGISSGTAISKLSWHSSIELRGLWFGQAKI